jgi:hypothetical protein
MDLSSQTQSDTGEAQKEPNPHPLYDETFYIKKQRWGTYVSYLAKDDKPIITSSTEDHCLHATRYYLKALQDEQKSI